MSGREWGRSRHAAGCLGFGPVLPPNMKVLARGTAVVLGLTSVVSGIAGIAAADPVVALNAVGFIGTCALSLAAIYYSVALERIGLTSARKAATSLVAVLAGSALLTTLLLFVLLRDDRFKDEAMRFGFQSATGILVLVVLAAVLGLLWRGR